MATPKPSPLCSTLAPTSTLGTAPELRPPHFAAMGGYAEAIAALLRARADPKARDNGGDTPRDYAVKQGHNAVAAVMERAGSGWE